MKQLHKKFNDCQVTDLIGISFTLIKSFSIFNSFMIFVSIALDIVRVGILRKYAIEKFSGLSFNRFTKAKNLVFLISKTFWISSLSTFFFVKTLFESCY